MRFDHPSVLCELLARGELDVALVSSFEFLRNPIYRIVDGVAIASDGPVYSVVLAHECDLDEIETVEVDAGSLTSVNLLRVLLGPKPKFVAETGAAPRGNRARLMIGDQAIRFRREEASVTVLDLGDAWRSTSGLPFVYALWLVRPEIGDAVSIATKLRELRDRNMEQLDALIDEECAPYTDFAQSYFRNNLRFDFGIREQQGLARFHEMCVAENLLPPGTVELHLI